MKDLISRLGLAPARFDCMGPDGAVDLSSKIAVPAYVDDATSACHLADQMVAEAHRYVGGGDSSVAPAGKWAFWCPFRSISWPDSAVVFSVELTQDELNVEVWRYELCFHSGSELCLISEECRFLAATQDTSKVCAFAVRYRSTECGMTVVRFRLDVPSRLHPDEYMMMFFPNTGMSIFSGLRR